MLFGLTLIAVIAGKDTLKGLIAGFFGLLIGVIGTDHIYNTPRATFGFLELYDGVPLVPALIGLFAISEALVMIEEKMIVDAEGRERALRARWADTVDGLRLSLQNWWHIVWTAFVGLFIGIMPGAGASIAAFVAYQQSRLWSKHPELYGTGIPEGVIAPEAANNGVTSGTLVPTLALGVPGGSTAAVMMIVLQYHGMVMGPRLFATNPEVAYGVFVVDGGGLHLHDLHHPAARALHVAHRADRDHLPRADHHPGDHRRGVRRAPVPLRHGRSRWSSA